MNSKSLPIFKFVKLTGVVVAFCFSMQAVSAHDLLGWRVRVPWDVRVYNQSTLGGVAKMAGDYSSTDELNVYVTSYSYQQYKTTVHIIKKDYCQLGKAIGWTQAWTNTNNGKWKACNHYPGGLTGECGGDNKVDYAYILINSCHPDLVAWRNAGGESFDRALLAHEMGHVVGLGEVPCEENDSIMGSDCWTANSFINKLMPHDKSDITDYYN